MRDAVLKKREIQEQQRKSEEANKAIKQQLQRSKHEQKQETKDLFGDFDNLKKNQMTSRPPLPSRGGKLSPLGTLHGRQPIHLDSSGMASPRYGWGTRNSVFDFSIPKREIPHLGADSTIKIPASQRMETIKNGQTVKHRTSGIFSSDGSGTNLRENSSTEQTTTPIPERLPKGFGIIDPLASFTSSG